MKRGGSPSDSGSSTGSGRRSAPALRGGTVAPLSSSPPNHVGSGNRSAPPISASPPRPKPPPAVKPYVAAMRHSVRADKDGSMEWCKDGMSPYDPPIVDYELPRSQARKLVAFGFTRIVCSPFLRCIQTSRVVAEVLQIPSVTIDYGVGEDSAALRRSMKVPRGSGAVVQYMNRHNMEIAARPVKVDSVQGTKPSIDEVSSEDRFVRTYANLADQFPGENILVVTHGDGVSALLSGMNVTVFETEECCFVVTQGPEIVHKDRLQYMDAID